MKPNTKFNLDVQDIQIIENCLHREINRISHQLLVSAELAAEDLYKQELIDLDSDIKKIHNLLGKLHTQKVWYRPKKKNYVSG